MKTVYRVEHKTKGIGPLTSEGLELFTEKVYWVYLVEEHAELEMYDSELDILPEHRFGMSTLASIKKLFRNWKKKKLLLESGFALFKMKVKDCRVFPDDQALFLVDDIVSREEIEMV